MSDPAPYARVAPYLMVDRGAEAIAFYKAAFGAEEFDRYEHEGKIGHVVLKINGGDVMLSDEFPGSSSQTGNASPATLGGSSATVNLWLEDVDAAMAQAIAAGAVALYGPVDNFYGRHGKLKDPFGHIWGLVGPKKA
jgi:PhnB protein